MICPGGGYECVCEYWEGERLGMAYAAAGFNAIVVNYTTWHGGNYPRQIKELARAFEITRDHAEEWHIDPHKIAVCGSSAGGHLAASLSTQRILRSRSMFPREYNWHKMSVDRLADVFGL